MTPAKPRWRPLLGDDLARRVAKVAAGGDPADWCRAAVLAAVEKAERTRATDPTRASCPHPEKDRQYGRCRACGTRGLPEITRSKASTP